MRGIGQPLLALHPLPTWQVPSRVLECSPGRLGLPVVRYEHANTLGMAALRPIHFGPRLDWVEVWPLSRLSTHQACAGVVHARSFMCAACQSSTCHHSDPLRAIASSDIDLNGWLGPELARPLPVAFGRLTAVGDDVVHALVRLGPNQGVKIAQLDLTNISSPLPRPPRISVSRKAGACSACFSTDCRDTKYLQRPDLTIAQLLLRKHTTLADSYRRRQSLTYLATTVGSPIASLRLLLHRQALAWTLSLQTRSSGFFIDEGTLGGVCASCVGICAHERVFSGGFASGLTWR